MKFTFEDLNAALASATEANEVMKVELKFLRKCLKKLRRQTVRTASLTS